MVGSRNALSPAQRQFFKSIKMQEVSLNVAWKMALCLDVNVNFTLIGPALLVRYDMLIFIRITNGVMLITTLPILWLMILTDFATFHTLPVPTIYLISTCSRWIWISFGHMEIHLTQFVIEQIRGTKNLIFPDLVLSLIKNKTLTSVMHVNTVYQYYVRDSRITLILLLIYLTASSTAIPFLHTT